MNTSQSINQTFSRPKVDYTKMVRMYEQLDNDLHALRESKKAQLQNLSVLQRLFTSKKEELTLDIQEIEACYEGTSLVISWIPGRLLTEMGYV